MRSLRQIWLENQIFKTFPSGYYYAARKGLESHGTFPWRTAKHSQWQRLCQQSDIHLSCLLSSGGAYKVVRYSLGIIAPVIAVGWYLVCDQWSLAICKYCGEYNLCCQKRLTHFVHLILQTKYIYAYISATPAGIKVPFILLILLYVLHLSWEMLLV